MILSPVSTKFNGRKGPDTYLINARCTHKPTPTNHLKDKNQSKQSFEERARHGEREHEDLELRYDEMQ
jgi:hypothetical protein